MGYSLGFSQRLLRCEDNSATSSTMMTKLVAHFPFIVFNREHWLEPIKLISKIRDKKTFLEGQRVNTLSFMVQETKRRYLDN